MGGPPSSLLTKHRGKRGQPKAGRPTRSPDLVVAAHGPHRLLVTCGVSWLVLHGGLAQFTSKRLVVPSYKYKRRGLK